MELFITRLYKTRILPFLVVVFLFMAGCKKNELELPPVDNIAPGGFSSLALIPGNGSVAAAWDRLGDDDIDYLLVTYIDSTELRGKEIISRRYARDREQVVINNLENFKEYEFTFVVVDKYGNTSDSVIANAIPVAEILNVFAKGGTSEGSVDITWEDPVDNYGAFTSISFYHGANLLGDIQKGVEQATFLNLTPGQELTITAKIKLNDGQYSKGIQFVVKPRIVLPPPGEVKNATIKGKSNLLELTWENPTDDNFSFVEIYWGQGSNRESATNHFIGKIDTLEDGRLKIIIRGLTNATDYTVVIKTSDDQGNASEGVVLTAKPINTTFVGNVNIASQQDVDAFDPSITYIQGNLRIENASNLTNLDNLGNIDSISGLFLYKSNSSWSYVEMDDFRSLQSVGGDLTFESIWTGARITMPMLKTVGGNFLVRYTNLNFIKAPKLASVGNDMYFLGLGTAFNEFDFSSLTRVGARLLFADIPNLQTLNGFTALQYVGSHFVVGRDPWGATGKTCGIKDYCGVRGLMQTGYIGGTITIESAPYTPTKEDIVAGRCAQ